MAAEQKTVDLVAVSAWCKVPYSTLARWAIQNDWPVAHKVGKRRYYDWAIVKAAIEKHPVIVAEAQAA